MEIGVALFMARLALIVIVGSLQVGIGWGAEGPKAGFFPFYIGADRSADRQRRQSRRASFARARRPQAVRRMERSSRKVLSVVIPTAIYVVRGARGSASMSASLLLIAVFMKWLGRYGWRMVRRDLDRRADR